MMGRSAALSAAETAWLPTATAAARNSRRFMAGPRKMRALYDLGRPAVHQPGARATRCRRWRSGLVGRNCRARTLSRKQRHERGWLVPLWPDSRLAGISDVLVTFGPFS